MAGEEQTDVISPFRHTTPPPITKTRNPRKHTGSAFGGRTHKAQLQNPGTQTPAHTVTQKRKHSQSHHPHLHTITPRSHSLYKWRSRRDQMPVHMTPPPQPWRQGQPTDPWCYQAASPSADLARYAFWFCLFPSVSLSLSLHLFQSPCLSAHLSVSLCLYLFVSLSLSLAVTLSASVSPQLSAFPYLFSLCLGLSVFTDGTATSTQLKQKCPNRPISTHKCTSHSDTHAKTDTKRSCGDGRLPPPSPALRIFFNFSVGAKMAGPRLRSGPGAVRGAEAPWQGAGWAETCSSHTLTHADSR